MNVSAETPTHDITIAGIPLAAPAPYTEGHTLTTNEAAVLNQTLAENLRNNFASKVKAAVAKANGIEKVSDLPTGDEYAGLLAAVDTDALASEFAAYVTEYEFGVRRTGTSRGPVDPVEREAVSMAREKVKVALKKKGLNLKDVDAETINKAVEQVLEKYPVIREQAAQVVAMRSEVAADELELDV